MDENEHRVRTPGQVTRADDEATTRLHASAVSFAGRGVLVVGRSGSGKSGLALQLISRGAALVADDQVILRQSGGKLYASAPPALAGLIEARGVGLIRLAFVRECPINLLVDLDSRATDRMPPRRTFPILGTGIELIAGAEVPNLDAVVTVLGQPHADMV